MTVKTFTWSKTSTDDFFSHYEISKDEGTTWNDIGTVASYEWLDIPLGEQTIQIRAVSDRDEYSNILELSFEVIKAMLLNKISMEEVDYPWNRTFTWELPDGLLVKYQIKLDDGVWTDAGIDTSYTWNDISEEEHTFAVKAIDVLDNETTIEWPFTLVVNDLVIESTTDPFDYLI
jgi:peptide/nickel transport system substrate-binding protein